MAQVALIGGIRTPYVKMGNAFKDLTADDLGASVVKELLNRFNLGGREIDEVIIGNVSQPAEAANVARVIALRAGLPKSISAYTVHRNCASGLQAIADGYDKIALGLADIVIAGGVESMSNIPFLYGKELRELVAGIMSAKTMSAKIKLLAGLKLKYLKPVVGLLAGLSDPLIGMNMGQTAEVLAETYDISRKEQDEFALASHQKAEAAIKKGNKADYARFMELDRGRAFWESRPMNLWNTIFKETSFEMVGYTEYGNSDFVQFWDTGFRPFFSHLASLRNALLENILYLPAKKVFMEREVYKKI